MKLPGKRAKESSRGGESVARQAQSEEVLRLRARRRLIGAVALVLTGVVVFPLIFETQPRPVASNIALIVPPQNQASSVAPPAPTASRAASPTQATPAAAVSPAPAPSSVRTPVQEPVQRPAQAPAQAPAQTPEQAPVRAQAAAPAAPRVAPTPAPQRNPQAQTPTRQAPEASARPGPQVAQARQALAALEDKAPSQISAAQAERAAQPASGRPAPAASANDRFVVQAGAYADAATARQVRRRIDAAGLHSYTQVVDTPAGKRVRVRVGPFASRSQAEHALQRIRSLGISAAVLSL